MMNEFSEKLLQLINTWMTVLFYSGELMLLTTQPAFKLAKLRKYHGDISKMWLDFFLLANKGNYFFFKYPSRENRIG